jgi:UDP-N-acetylglucosamine 2-epimerase (non-hydrolysing)
MGTLRICSVVGARPNFIKVAPLIAEMRRRGGIVPVLVHTGQHSSPEMSGSFFRDLELPHPDLSLGVSRGTQTEQTAEIMRRIEPALLNLKPNVVLVVGDVNSTVAAALVAAKLRLSVVHVEAGLRSFDRSMPEEINRVVTDAISDLLFVTEPSGRSNLLAEGVSEDRIFFVGNVMIDSLVRCASRAQNSTVLQRLGLADGRYALATLHRPSNVDDDDSLASLIAVLRTLAGRLPVVFPIHPRTRSRIEATGIDTSAVLVTPPFGYLDFLRLTTGARLVLTDSGGIQEDCKCSTRKSFRMTSLN